MSGYGLTLIVMRTVARCDKPHKADSPDSGTLPATCHCYKASNSAWIATHENVQRELEAFPIIEYDTDADGGIFIIIINDGLAITLEQLQIAIDVFA